MTLLHIDGFEGYGKEDVLSFWSSGSFISASSLIDQSGRRGGYCVNSPNRVSNSGVKLIWDNINRFDEQVIIVGCALKVGASLGNNTEGFINIVNQSNNDPIALVSMDIDYKLKVKYQPSQTKNILFTSEVIDQDTWYYIELKAKMHSTTGIVEFRMNEQLLYQGSNLDTVAWGSSGTQIGGVVFNFTIYNRLWLDDIYIIDTTGSVNNDFLGDIRVDSIHPNGAGNYTQLTPSAGSNYECIDEINMDDTDYVEGANAGDKDSYSYANAPTDLDDAGIFGIQLNTQAIRTAESDNIKMKGFLRTGSTDYEETTAQSLSDIVTSKKIIWEDDPSDSNIWTQAKINACEFGVEVN